VEWELLSGSLDTTFLEQNLYWECRHRFLEKTLPSQFHFTLNLIHFTMKKIQRWILVCLLTATSISFLLSPANALGQTAKRSIANGSWFDPNIWSPAGVPSPQNPTDSLIITTDVTFSALLDARGVAHHLFVVKAGASLRGTSANDTLILGVVDYLVNDGVISNQSNFALGGINVYTRNTGQIFAKMMLTSDSFLQDGTIDADYLVTSGTFTNTAGSEIQTRALTTSDNFINAIGGVIIVAESLITSNVMVNDGDISTAMFINSGSVSGSTGKFCVADCFINNDTITGTLDICDASPLGFCDFNLGYIDGTVTSCASGACATVSSEEPIPNANLVKMYPNPSDGRFTVDAKAFARDLTIYESSGKRLLAQKISSGLTEIDLTGLSSGIYLAKIEDGMTVQIIKLMVQ
jgi:Secretion system C-terminal sorting domain